MVLALGHFHDAFQNRVVAAPAAIDRMRGGLRGIFRR